jgi:hypothetical protein
MGFGLGYMSVAVWSTAGSEVNGVGVHRCQPTLDVSANSPHGLTTFVTVVRSE